MKWLPDREDRMPGWIVVSILALAIVAFMCVGAFVEWIPNRGMTKFQFIGLCVVMWLMFVLVAMKKTKARKDAEARQYAEIDALIQANIDKFQAKRLKGQQGDGI